MLNDFLFYLALYYFPQIVENLKLYLESDEIKVAENGGIYLPYGNETHQFPLYLGCRFKFKGDMNDTYNAGGSGYTINKAALKKLVVEGFSYYWPHNKTFMEDVMIGRTLRKLGIFPYETKDESGGERYMHFTPGQHYTYRKDVKFDWYARYSMNVKEGLDHCAKRSVAFHYIKGDLMFRLHALLYGLCANISEISP